MFYNQKEKELRQPSPRQLATLELVKQGYSNTQIANKLGIKVETVKAHVAALFRTFGVGNRVQLALLAKQREPDAPVTILVNEPRRLRYLTAVEIERVAESVVWRGSDYLWEQDFANAIIKFVNRD
jgi:DNA-binding CsgD family transcriptional regulator